MAHGESVMEYCEVRGVDETPPVFHRAAADPDASLVERLRRQETSAAETLVATYGDRVYRLAIGITGNRSDAEEVVQDVLWTASRKIDTFRGTAAFGSWLYRITANAAYQKLRGMRNARNTVPWDEVAPTLDVRGQHKEAVPDWSARLNDPATQAELRSWLASAIEELPADYRATFLLHDVEGLSSGEIAQSLQVKVSTVKSRVHRARLFLRKRLADYTGATAA
jgi:RNA polymerase sigma-70 factor (ECF subfamily)